MRPGRPEGGIIEGAAVNGTTLRKIVPEPPLVASRGARARGAAFETLYTRYAQSTFAFFLPYEGPPTPREQGPTSVPTPSEDQRS